eukprot:12095_1
MSDSEEETPQEQVEESRIRFELTDKTIGEDEFSDLKEMAKDAFEDSKTHKEVAQKLKITLEAKYPQCSWHCIVGENFAASISHDTRFRAFFKVTTVGVNDSERRCNVLAFKTRD